MTALGCMTRVRNLYIQVTAKWRRRKLNNDTFTIISNNCWGGLVYKSYGLRIQTPTAGMYFMAEEYIKFLTNLKYYICDCELTFIDPKESKYRSFYEKDKRFGSFPIAMLDDVEIAMLHYKSEEEAVDKWRRRCGRICWDKLIVKMNDQNGCTALHAEQFSKLPFENKLFFTVNDYDGGMYTVQLPDHGTHTVGLLQEPFGASRRFDVNRYINAL